MDELRKTAYHLFRRPFVDKPNWYERLPVLGYTVPQEWYDAKIQECEDLHKKLEECNERKVK